TGTRPGAPHTRAAVGLAPSLQAPPAPSGSVPQPPPLEPTLPKSLRGRGESEENPHDEPAENGEGGTDGSALG
ncbi:hypothetical protein ACWD4I_26465, partial [Streptomyces sp. NPDC002535]